MLALVTSANVACGFHAGDPSTMRRHRRAAAGRGVSVGAHVSLSATCAGSAAAIIDVRPAALADDVLYQLGALEALCRVAGTGCAT